MVQILKKIYQSLGIKMNFLAIFESLAIKFLIPSFTWFVLFCLGKNPILDGENIFIGNYQLILSKGCLGADNLYFALSTLIIYSF